MSGFRPRFFMLDTGATGGAAAGGADAGAGDLCDTELLLSAEDSHHASRVLRLQPGDQCEVVVGAAVYAATVSAVTDRVRVRLTTRLEGPSAGASYDIQVGIVQALGRPAAMDYVLEKGTEVGASFFWFVKAAGSPKQAGGAQNDRLTRWLRIVREAAKQSKQVNIPDIRVASSVEEALAGLQNDGAFSVVLDLGAAEGLDRAVAAGFPDAPRPSPVALWVGPEGGWSNAELERFAAARLSVARLGRSVLRTETAGPVAVAVARLALRDW
ncbi:MAG: 16S rRNA (uracil(1498)-N(3))-methyltransferase [Actinobacteria bacterium]|nr:16S rRNA (uracil(1498)-N(3))-methyltransferase [Actinomycetota bacterium]